MEASSSPGASPPSDGEQSDGELAAGPWPLLLAVGAHLRLILVLSLAAGLLALGITYLIKPTFTARTVLLPPQQQNSAAAALASLGALSGLAGAATGIKSPVDQYVALMQSTTVADRMIDEFKLMALYDEKYRVETRRELARNVRMAAGKRDGLISIEVDDEDPARAAAMANRFVDELRRITSLLALTEAQQRRVFFEAQVKLTRDNLTKAQLSLQTSGFNPGALKAEPKAAAENYARMRAEVTAAEVRLETLRRNLADLAPEVQQQQTRVGALRAALSRLETSTDSVNEPGYVGKYREFKYQETLFELFSRQYELARVDESREGALVQVVDVASPPERKTKPKRGMIAVVTTLLTLGLALGFVVLRHLWRQAASDPMTAHKLELLRGTFRRGRTG